MKVNNKRWLNAQRSEKAFWSRTEVRRKELQKYWEPYISAASEYFDLSDAKVLDIGCGPNGLIYYVVPPEKVEYSCG